MALTCAALADEVDLNAKFDGVTAYNQGSYDKAAKLLLKSAQQGDRWAQLHLGLSLLKAEPPLRDYAAAANWLTLASDQGDSDAQYILALMYQRGDGVTRDVVQAWKWFTLAGDAGVGAARVAREQMVSELRPSFDQMDAAKRLVREWREERAREKH